MTLGSLRSSLGSQTSQLGAAAVMLLSVVVTDPCIIDIVGSYLPTIDVVGEHRTTVNVVGSHVPTIDVVGETCGD